VPFEDNAQKAAQDAPWRRHTRLNIDVKATYERVRIDHWLYDTHEHRAAGWIVLVLLIGGATVSGVIFIRRTRSDDA
jgi:hypothetical protein